MQYVPKSILTFFLCAVVIFCSGCQGGEIQDDVSVEGNTEPVASIGVSVLTMTHPFFLEMVDELRKTAEANNFEVVINSSEFDVAVQKNQISDFIVQQVDALIICPADSRAIGTAIKEANMAGIPVFTADIAVLVDDVEVIAHVGIDNYEGGRMAGELALGLLDGDGQIAIVDHPEVESVIQRTKGFMDVINDALSQNEAVEVVSRLPGSGSMDKSFKATEDILQAHPEVDVIFGINDETALGAVAAIEKAGKSGTVQVIGFGGKEEALKAVREGTLYADIITHPRQIGSRVIKSIARYMQGEEVEAVELIPTQVYQPGQIQ